MQDMTISVLLYKTSTGGQHQGLAEVEFSLLSFLFTYCSNGIQFYSTSLFLSTIVTTVNAFFRVGGGGVNL